ncbi:hypothetical protein V1478_004465 [Vespula squamosa]|uniref:Uncharacterized protein n=1 Tax=Vespula squamosa TaxID=30214 RepID=A0ABD2BG98_VESSQ
MNKKNFVATVAVNVLKTILKVIFILVMRLAVKSYYIIKKGNSYNTGTMKTISRMTRDGYQVELKKP